MQVDGNEGWECNSHLTLLREAMDVTFMDHVLDGPGVVKRGRGTYKKDG